MSTAYIEKVSVRLITTAVALLTIFFLVITGVYISKQKITFSVSAYGESCYTIYHGSCVSSNYICNSNYGQSDCASGSYCGVNCAPPSSTPTPPPGSSCYTIYHGSCVPASYVCNSNYGQSDCGSGYYCGVNCTPPSPTPTPNNRFCAIETDGSCVPNFYSCVSEYGSYGCGSNYKCGANCTVPLIKPCTYCDTDGGSSTGTCVFTSTPCSGFLCSQGSSCSAVVNANFGNCASTDGFPWCRQTNPLWANVTYGCNAQLKTYTCGQSVVSSVWCKYSGGNCDVVKEIEAGKFKNGNNQLCLTDSSDLYSVLSRSEYNGDYNLAQIRPESGQQWITKDQLIQYLQNGNVIIASGIFKPTGTGAERVDHHTLIVGVDSDGKLIFHDPYFNCDNENATDKKCTTKLEDEMEYIDISKAIVVSKP